MSKCSSCGAEIKWIKLKSGKWNPVDPYKHTMIRAVIGESITAVGTDELVTDSGEVIRGRLASREEGANAAGYISHFATCPNAAQHRRK